MERGTPLLEAFTTRGPSHAYSEEQQLAARMFRQRLPAGTPLTVLERGAQSASRVLSVALAERLASAGPLPTYFLVAETSWLFLGVECVTNLIRLLEQQPRLACALPSDQGDHPSARAAPYHTLRGFEQFTHALQASRPQWCAYDGRAPFLFLLRADVLRDLRPLDDLFGLPARLGERSAIALDAYAHRPVGYYGQDRADILPLVPEEVTSLLDIGCATGNFGALLKAHRTCRVVGIELNPVAGEQARERLDRVVVGDALKVDPGERFECVTCLDTLEHVPHPDKLLSRIGHDFLRPGGYFVASVPNVGHWSIVADLLAGRWDYVPIGLMCVTHLRFFTLTSLRRLLAEHGFEILHIGCVSDPMPRAMRYLLQLCGKLGLALDEANLDVVNYHLLCRLT